MKNTTNSQICPFPKKDLIKILSFGVFTALASNGYAQSTQITYDAQSRPSLVQESSASGVVTSTSQIQYDTANASGSRIKKIMGPSPASSGVGPVKEEYGYLNGSDSNILTTRSSSRSTEQYSVNGLGQVSGESSPEKGSVSIVLNPDGSVHQVTDARGSTLTATYTPGGSPSSLTGSDTSLNYTYGANGTSGAGLPVRGVKSGAFGTTDTQIGYNKSGRVTSKSQSVTTLEETGTTTNTVSYTYTAGKLATITYPSGHVVSYVYSGPVVSQVLLDGKPLISNIAFTAGVEIGGVAQGAFTSWDGVYNQGNAVGAPTVPYRLGVNNKGQITSYSFGGMLANGQWGLRTLGWNSDKMTSRVATRVTPGNARNPLDINETFTYDNLDHVTSTDYSEYNAGAFSRKVTFDYAFNTNNGLTQQGRTITDATGLVTPRTLSATIASNSDRPTYARIWNTRIGIYENQTYSYDASGNLTQISSELTDTSKNYVIGLGWNSLGQLASMTNTNPATTMPNDPGALHGASSASYYYDAFGARIRKVTKDASGQLLMSTGFVYSDVDHYKILSEYAVNYDSLRNPTGYGYTSLKEYIYLPMPENQNTWVPVAMMRQTSYTGFDVHYLHVDQLGSVQSVVQAKAAASPSAAGANVSMASYPGVLGDNRHYVKWDFIQNGPFNLRSPGQYFDTETGLLYNNARYFNPRIGAFISGDPIGRNGGTNVYAYGIGSLVNDVDESGFWATDAHDYIIDQYFTDEKGYTKQQRNWIKEGSAFTDRFQAQISGDSALHAMKNLYDKEHHFGDTAEFAHYRMCNHVNNNLDLFRDKSKLEKDRFKALGEALHPIMDSTSPAHSYFKTWYWLNAFVHGGGPTSMESLDDLKADPDLIKATNIRMTAVLEGDTSCLCVHP